LIDKTTRQLEISRRLRAIVRARESSLIALAALVGAIAGVVVAVMSTSVDMQHRLFFDLEPGARLSALFRLNPLVALFVPLVGGLAFGVAGELIARHRPERDPIEANALHGGRMSPLGSVIVAAQTIWSSGVGASVGLEAGYTQLASGIASRVGMAFRLRHADLRILVGCGAAGVIAGAFGAPIAGAFYGFELIIGRYSPNSLAPVGISALIGFLVAQALAPAQIGVVAPEQMVVATHDLVIAATIGLLSAALGILLMRGVAVCEMLFRLWARPALRTTVGGLAVGLLAIASPQVMSSGHGALHISGIFDFSLRTVALFFVLKIAASIVSLGSGFRGGLFFSSLLTGALGGHLLAIALTMMWPNHHFDSNAYAVIGMSALAASVIGGSLTMTFIALETTGDLWLTTAVLVAVIISAQTTREAFGYSFATWRFPSGRGETIRSAADIGWMRDLTVGKMMRHDVRAVPAATTVASFRETFPLGSPAHVIAVDEEGRYAGMVRVADAYATTARADEPIRGLLRSTTAILLPGMAIKEAMLAFDRAEAEALAVVDSSLDRGVIGLLTEADAIRRYAAELEHLSLSETQRLGGQSRIG
jgi:CIC family chloride channel protein